MDGLGFHHMWGMSPAQDLNGLADQLKLFERQAQSNSATTTKTTTTTTTSSSRSSSRSSSSSSSSKSDNSNSSRSSSDNSHSSRNGGSGSPLSPLNILLIKPGDIRSILKTVTQRHRIQGEKRPLHFYIWEETTEILARHLLLLQVFQEWSIPIRQRCNLWLEIFGNTLVQERTMHYIDAKGRQLIKLVCDGTGPLSGVVDVQHLRYRVRDELETTFKSWSVKVPFDAKNLLEHRLRGLHKDRYDFRKGAVDWDLHNGLKEFGASIVHIKQYRTWRETGVAFEFGDQTYTNPNRSLGSYMLGRTKDEGLSKMVKGLWTDVVASPYISLGLECHMPNKFAKDLFYIVNKGRGTEQHRHNTAEVACYNMASFMHETETGQVYEMSREHEVFSGLGVIEDAVAGPKSTPEQVQSTTESTAPKEGEPDSTTNEEDGASNPQAPAKVFVDHDVSSTQEQALKRALNIAETWKNVKVFPLGGGSDSKSLPDLLLRQPFKEKFHIVWVGNLQVHQLPEASAQNGGVQRFLAKPAAAVVVETLRHVVAVRKDMKLGFLDKVEGFALHNGWTSLQQRKPGNPLDPDCRLEHLIYICKEATRARNIERAETRRKNLERLNKAANAGE